jgi:anaerobic dimethyl sulfoxide reductase subunit B (iron-sulfur subunit)
MEQWGFLIDTQSCVGCKACEIACKNRNHLGVGPRLRRVSTIESGEFPDTVVTNISLACMHCGKPACVAVCPTGALFKRSQDGVVIVDRTKCIGCHYCFFACPFGVPQYADDGTMVKCDLCTDRREVGLEPACVQTCFYHALYAGPLTELSSLMRDKMANRLAGSSDPSILVIQ